MAELNNFKSADSLGKRIERLGREELLDLVSQLCLFVADFSGDAHGKINPENVILTPDGAVGLREAVLKDKSEFSAAELEYMAPELFWDGVGDASADVYSLGMLLYCGVSHGRLPFFPKDYDGLSEELRSAALHLRMNGAKIVVPKSAGTKLGAVIEKALQFKAGDRYPDTTALRQELAVCCGVGDAVAVPLFGKPERELTEIERMMTGLIASGDFDDDKALDEVAVGEQNSEATGEDVIVTEEPSGTAGLPDDTHSDIEDDDDEELEVPSIVAAHEPPEVKAPFRYAVDKDFEKTGSKKSKKVKRILIAVLVALIVFGIGAVVQYFKSDITEILSDFFAPKTPVAQISALPETAAPASALPEIESPSPPIETEPPVSEYKIFFEDISWTAAADKCAALGGHLVTISDEEELERVTELATANGATMVWVGLYRDLNGELQWVTGEEVSFTLWAPGEPSLKDTDGTAERYTLLWNMPQTGWAFNDSRDDPFLVYPQFYSGKIAYICETDPQ